MQPQAYAPVELDSSGGPPTTPTSPAALPADPENAPGAERCGEPAPTQQRLMDRCRRYDWSDHDGPLGSVLQRDVAAGAHPGSG